VPVAAHAGGQTDFLVALDPPAEWAARNALLHRRFATSSSRPN